MPKNTYERKDSSLSFRVSEDEYRELKRLAKESRMNVSDYIRARLWEEVFSKLPIEKNLDPKAKFACDHDREMMRFSIRSFLYAKHMAQKVLDKDTYEQCKAIANSKLKEWGYE